MSGPLDRDYDDVRRFSDAGAAGVKRALAAGSKNPLLVVHGSVPGQSGDCAALAGLLGALSAVYVPLEIRDLGQEKQSKVTGLGWAGDTSIMEEALAIETGRVVSRDIGGSDPERTAAPRVEEYVRNLFSGTNVKVEVVQGQATFEKEYPCLAAVNRSVVVWIYFAFHISHLFMTFLYVSYKIIRALKFLSHCRQGYLIFTLYLYE